MVLKPLKLNFLFAREIITNFNHWFVISSFRVKELVRGVTRREKEYKLFYWQASTRSRGPLKFNCPMPYH